MPEHNLLPPASPASARKGQLFAAAETSANDPQSPVRITPLSLLLSYRRCCGYILTVQATLKQTSANDTPAGAAAVDDSEAKLDDDERKPQVPVRVSSAYHVAHAPTHPRT